MSRSRLEDARGFLLSCKSRFESHASAAVHGVLQVSTLPEHLTWRTPPSGAGSEAAAAELSRWSRLFPLPDRLRFRRIESACAVSMADVDAEGVELLQLELF